MITKEHINKKVKIGPASCPSIGTVKKVSPDGGRAEVYFPRKSLTEWLPTSFEVTVVGDDDNWE